MSAINCHVWVLFTHFYSIFCHFFTAYFGVFGEILYFLNFRDNLSLIYDIFLVSFSFFCVIIYCILGNFYHFLADIIVYFWDNLSGIYATQIPYRTQVVNKIPKKCLFFYSKRAPSPAKNWSFAWKIENRPTKKKNPDPQLHQISKPIWKFFCTFLPYSNLS